MTGGELEQHLRVIEGMLRSLLRESEAVQDGIEDSAAAYRAGYLNGYRTGRRGSPSAVERAVAGRQQKYARRAS